MLGQARADLYLALGGGSPMAKTPVPPESEGDKKVPNNGAFTAEVKELIATSLRDVVSTSQIPRVVDALAPKLVQSIKVTATKMHIGPMPTVETAAGYEDLYPGSIERMFRLAEVDQKAFIEAQADIRARDDRFRIIALFAGLFALALILGGAIWLALTGHDWVAGGIAGIGASGIIATLVNAASPLRRRESNLPENVPKSQAPKAGK